MMCGYERKVKIVDGKVEWIRYVPNEMEKKRRAFIKAMDKQGAWMTETTMKQILGAYNEAFDTHLECFEQGNY